MINECHIVEDTPAWDVTHITLMLARGATKERIVYVRRSQPIIEDDVFF